MLVKQDFRVLPFLVGGRRSKWVTELLSVSGERTLVNAKYSENWLNFVLCFQEQNNIKGMFLLPKNILRRSWGASWGIDCWWPFNPLF